METIDTVISRAIPEIKSKLKCPDEARTYNFVYEFLMIVAHQMTLFGTEQKHFRIKEILLIDLQNKEAFPFCQNPRTNR